MKNKDQVVKQVSGYHLVIRLEDDKLSFFAYKQSKNLNNTFNNQSLPADVKIFQTIQNLYEYLDNSSDQLMRIEENFLVFSLPLGKIIKNFKLKLKVQQMSREKQIKIELKNMSHKLKDKMQQINLIKLNLQQLVIQQQANLKKKQEETGQERKFEQYLQNQIIETNQIKSQLLKSKNHLRGLQNSHFKIRKMLNLADG